MDLFLAVPFAAGIILKVFVFIVSSGTQKAALARLEEGHKKATSSAVLTDGQRNVVLSVLGLSTATITAASTLITSLVTFLIVALRYQQKWIWGCWVLDLVLSTVLWFYIKSRKQPYQRVWRLKVSTFLLLLSGLLDALGLVPTIVATRRAASPKCSSELHCPAYPNWRMDM